MRISRSVRRASSFIVRHLLKFSGRVARGRGQINIKARGAARERGRRRRPRDGRGETWALDHHPAARDAPRRGKQGRSIDVVTDQRAQITHLLFHERTLTAFGVHGVEIDDIRPCGLDEMREVMDGVVRDQLQTVYYTNQTLPTICSV